MCPDVVWVQGNGLRLLAESCRILPWSPVQHVGARRFLGGAMYRPTSAANVAEDQAKFIRWVMDKYPATAKDDTLLLLAVWHEQGLRLSKAQTSFIRQHGIKPETVIVHPIHLKRV